MYELKKYHGDRVQSLTYDDDKIAFSVGIISPGEYQFGAIKKEIFTVTYGSISVWEEESNEWNDYENGETFIIRSINNFILKVDKISAYICHYE